MKTVNMRVMVFALGTVLASSAFTPILHAQAQSTAPSAQQEQKTQTIIGKIIKTKNGQYALVTDEQAGKGVYLDDSDKAKDFEGKTVRVTGILEPAKSLFHVSNIEAA